MKKYIYKPRDSTRKTQDRNQRIENRFLTPVLRLLASSIIFSMCFTLLTIIFIHYAIKTEKLFINIDKKSSVSYIR